MNANQRKDLALQMFSSSKISELAVEQKITRKFLYTQKSKALDTVDYAFSNNTADGSDVLFSIPVTQKWLDAMVLLILLHCSFTYSGIQRLFSDMIDRNISAGKIYNVIIEAKIQAMDIKSTEELDGIEIALEDELYQYNKPVLAGKEHFSLYCYLLVDKEKRDGDTWGINLLEAVEYKFNLKKIIAGNVKGIESGSQVACPNAVYSKDNFHITKDLLHVKRFFANTLKSTENEFLKQQIKMDRAKSKKQGNKLSSKHNVASKALNLHNTYPQDTFYPHIVVQARYNIQSWL